MTLSILLIVSTSRVQADSLQKDAIEILKSLNTRPGCVMTFNRFVLVYHYTDFACNFMESSAYKLYTRKERLLGHSTCFPESHYTFL